MAYQGGTLKSTSINGVKVYTIASQHRSLATWLPPKKVKSLRKNKDYMQRVELIQELRFEVATKKIKFTPDGQYLIATGTYKPKVKVYELGQLSLKVERVFDADIIDFEILDEDYSKLAFLCDDRSICLHAKYGKHYSLRIPRMGRDMEYDCWSCDLLCAASSPDLYRINLEQGRFLLPLSTQSPALNVVSRSKLHGLVACGGEDGAVECFDMRTRSSVGRINAVAPAGDADEEVTALEFEGTYNLAVGSSGGKILLYDLRSSSPTMTKDHMYGSKILDIKWHRTLNSELPKLITTDQHIVRIWDPDTGEGMTSIEPEAGTTINDICVFKDSGLMFLALDSSHIPPYFLPALGPAPKWCSYLENLTEELEESGQTTIYDHFKFLTKQDLERLNLAHYIGTDCVRAYLHGYFIDNRLYKRAQSQVEAFEYESYVEQRKQEKLEAERASRITIKRKLPKVNRGLAARLLEDEQAEAETETEKRDADDKKKSKKKGLTTEILKDERFAAMFENKDYQIDEFCQEYLALHPASKKPPSLVNEHFDPVVGDDDKNLSDSDVSMESQSSEDELNDGKDEARKKSRAPRLYEVKDERHAEAFANRVSLAKEDALPLGERVAALEAAQASRVVDDIKFGPGGSREISFKSRSSAKYKEDEEDKDSLRGKRRGVQSLGLKPDRSLFRGQGRGKGRGRGRGRGRR